jgi:hypothetical protein
MPVLPPHIRARFRSVDNIAVVSVIVKLRQALSANFRINPNDPAMDIPGLIEYGNSRPMGQARQATIAGAP